MLPHKEDEDLGAGGVSVGGGPRRGCRVTDANYPALIMNMDKFCDFETHYGYGVVSGGGGLQHGGGGGGDYETRRGCLYDQTPVHHHHHQPSDCGVVDDYNACTLQLQGRNGCPCKTGQGPATGDGDVDLVSAASAAGRASGTIGRDGTAVAGKRSAAASAHDVVLYPPGLRTPDTLVTGWQQQQLVLQQQQQQLINGMNENNLSQQQQQQQPGSGYGCQTCRSDKMIECA